MARYALVVGISHYESEYFESLSKAIIDANAVADLLKQDKRYKNVEVLTGEVTGAKLVGALKTFLQKQTVKNEALIYFTGHGFTVVDIAGETEGYLATSDCSVTIEDGHATAQKGGLPLNTLNKLIQASDLSNLVVLLDACHSGALLERDLVEQSFKAFGLHTDYYLITGCRGFEEGIAKKREQHSVFTGALVGGLSQNNADEYGKVTGDRLFDFIYRELRSSKQEPIRMGIGRSIVLLEFPSRTKAVTAILDEKGEVICPYQGLQAFDRNQKEFFFGRKRLVEAIKQNLDNSRFVPVIGASGSGKSSVVRAGVIPWLEEEGNWQILEPIKPGFEPLVELRGAFKIFFKGRDEKQLKAFIEERDKNPKGLANIVERLSGSEQFLLVIDQFEEVFTVCANEGERQRFIELITQVTEIPDCRLSVVTTMRADFLEPCLRYPSLYQQIQKQAVFMPPLAGIDLRDAITEPAQRQGYILEEELVFKILEDVGKEPGFLPLLEFALTKLWHKRDQEKYLLTLEEYKKLGGLAGALDLHAEQVYRYRDFASDSPVNERDEKEKNWIQRIFLRLVRTGEQEKDTRQRQPKVRLLAIAGDELEEQEALGELLEGEGGLVQGRLLVTGQDRQEVEPWVDLAHEALLEGWNRLRKWRKEDRQLLRLIERIEHAFREWHNSPNEKKHENLMSRGLLVLAREQWQQLKPYLESEVEKFFEISDTSERRGQQALAKAALREQSERVLNLLSVQPVEALVRAVQATGISLLELNEVFEPIENSLKRAVETLREDNVFIGHKGWVNSVCFSPDGQYIVSGSQDGTIRIWAKDGALVREFRVDEQGINSIALSKDGYIVSGGNSKTICLWKLDSELVVRTMCTHEGSVSSVAFSPNGQYIISGSRDKTLKLWNFKGDLVRNFSGHSDSVICVAFSPDGQYIISGSRDKTLKLWNFEGKLLGVLKGHSDTVLSVAFHPVHLHIISGSRDGSIRLWSLHKDVVTNINEAIINKLNSWVDLTNNVLGDKLDSLLSNLKVSLMTSKLICDNQAAVYSVNFSPDGQYIVSAHRDDTVRLWDLNGNLIDEPLRGHEAAVISACFSPDGQQVVSGSDDRTIRVWSFQPPTITTLIKTEHFDSSSGSSIKTIKFSPDGQYVCIGNYDGEVEIFDLNGSLIHKLYGGSPIHSIAVSSNSRHIVSSDEEGTVCLHDINGNLNIRIWELSETAPYAITFNSDGKLIATSNLNGEVQLWNLAGDSITDDYRDTKEIISGEENVVRPLFNNFIRPLFDEHSYRRIERRGNDIRPLWGTESESVQRYPYVNAAKTSSIAISPDNRYIVSGSGNRDGSIKLWDVQGKLIGQPWRRHEDAITSIDFSPNSQYVVSGSQDKTIRLWTLEGIQVGYAFRGHEQAVIAVTFSSDNSRIISGSQDGVIRLWDLEGNSIGESLKLNQSNIQAISFSPNAKYIAVASADGNLRVWQTSDWKSWLQIACDGLRNHSIFKNPEQGSIAEQACQICQKYIWNEAVKTSEEALQKRSLSSKYGASELQNTGVSAIDLGESIQEF
jgi:WD40 repeat protein